MPTMETCSSPQWAFCGQASACLLVSTHTEPLLTWSHPESLAGFGMRYSMSHLCVLAQARLSLRIPFPLSTWKPHSSFQDPLWEVFLFYQAFGCLWANTYLTHLSVTGLLRLDGGHWLLICLPYHKGSSKRKGLGLTQLWIPEPT